MELILSLILLNGSKMVMPKNIVWNFLTLFHFYFKYAYRLALFVVFLSVYIQVMSFFPYLQRDVAYCKIWWRTKLIIFIPYTVVITYAFVVSEDRLDFAVGGICGVLYQIYGLWVVKAFISELEFPRDCESKGIEKL